MELNEKFFNDLLAYAIDIDNINNISNAHGIMRRNTVRMKPSVDAHNYTKIELNIPQISTLTPKNLSEFLTSLLMGAEDDYFIQQLREITTDNTQIYDHSAFEPSDIMELYSTIEKNRLRVEKFIFNRMNLSDFISNFKDVMDPCTQRDLILQGLIGHIYGAEARTSSLQSSVTELQEVEIYALSEPSYVGSIEIGSITWVYSKETDVLTIKENIDLKLNSNGIARGIKLLNKDKSENGD